MKKPERNELHDGKVVSIESRKAHQVTQALLEKERVEAQAARVANCQLRLTRKLIKKLLDLGKPVEIGPLCVQSIPVARDSYTVAPKRYELLRVS